MVDLATLARRLGNLTEARNQLRRAYAIVVASSGPEHAASLSIEGRLAAVVYRLGERTEAYDWHLADAGRRVLGTEHPAVRGAQQRLAAASAVAPAQPLERSTDEQAWNTGEPGSHSNDQGWKTDNQGWTAHPVVSSSVTATYTAVADGVYRRRTDSDDNTAQPPVRPVTSPLGRRSRGGGVAIIASLGVVVLIAGSVVAYQVLRPDGGLVAPDPVSKPNTITVPAHVAPTPPTSPPPSRVVLKDDGGAITLSWADPSAGKVPFIVSGGRDGTALRALTSVPAGQTTSTIYGLNVNFDYCFTVSAVWSSENIQPSIRTCTFRVAATRAPYVAPEGIDRLQ
jgi:hypothetical protein